MGNLDLPADAIARSGGSAHTEAPKPSSVESTGRKYSLSPKNQARAKFITAVVLMTFGTFIGAGAAFVAKQWLKDQYDEGWPKTAFNTMSLELVRDLKSIPGAFPAKRVEVYKQGKFYDKAMEDPKKMIGKTLSYVEFDIETRKMKNVEGVVIDFTPAALDRPPNVGAFNLKSASGEITSVPLYLFLFRKGSVTVKTHDPESVRVHASFNREVAPSEGPIPMAIPVDGAVVNRATPEQQREIPAPQTAAQKTGDVQVGADSNPVKSYNEGVFLYRKANDDGGPQTLIGKTISYVEKGIRREYEVVGCDSHSNLAVRSTISDDPTTALPFALLIGVEGVVQVKLTSTENPKTVERAIEPRDVESSDEMPELENAKPEILSNVSMTKVPERPDKLSEFKTEMESTQALIKTMTPAAETQNYASLLKLGDQIENLKKISQSPLVKDDAALSRQLAEAQVFHDSAVGEYVKKPHTTADDALIQKLSKRAQEYEPVKVASLEYGGQRSELSARERAMDEPGDLEGRNYLRDRALFLKHHGSPAQQADANIVLDLFWRKPWAPGKPLPRFAQVEGATVGDALQTKGVSLDLKPILDAGQPVTFKTGQDFFAEVRPLKDLNLNEYMIKFTDNNGESHTCEGVTFVQGYDKLLIREEGRNNRTVQARDMNDIVMTRK